MPKPASFLQALTLLLAMSSPLAMAEYTVISWVDLLPEEDYRALLSAPPVQHSGDESAGQQLLRANGSAAAAGQDNTYDQAMYSTNVRTEHDGQDIQLPGFVVPLEYDENQNVTEFFLVPYFGACIHVPPPPPNQIIYVSYPEGLELASIYEPFTIEGRLTSTITSNDTAMSAYRIDAASVVLYEEE